MRYHTVLILLLISLKVSSQDIDSEKVMVCLLPPLPEYHNLSDYKSPFELYHKRYGVRIEITKKELVNSIKTNLHKLSKADSLEDMNCWIKLIIEENNKPETEVFLSYYAGGYYINGIRFENSERLNKLLFLHISNKLKNNELFFYGSTENKQEVIDRLKYYININTSDK